MRIYFTEREKHSYFHRQQPLILPSGKTNLFEVAGVKEPNTIQTVRISDVGEIGRAVRAARKAQGLTQREFADISGVGVRFLSELERGKPTAEVGLVLEVLADAGYDVVLQRRQLSSFETNASGRASGEDES